MSLTRRVLLAGAGLLSSIEVAAEPDTLIYPRHEALQDAQIGYILALMRLALTRSKRRYKLSQTASVMVQSRALIELSKPNAPVDVFWTMTNRQREQTLLPIRIPLERGLIGWRLALVRRADRERLREVRRLSDLAPFKAGQMHDWPDTAILRANGLTVETSTHCQSLFQMLAMGRIDYFPRSLIEITTELEAYRHLDLAIEPNLLLYYPTALYLFVNPRRPLLAADLTEGLEAIQADGSFERLFRQQFGPLLSSHEMAKRQVLRLHNPELPPDTPLQRKGLWLAPPSRS